MWLLLVVLAACTNDGADTPSDAEMANPKTCGVQRKIVARLPFHVKPQQLTVSVVDNGMFLEGDIALRPDNIFDWTRVLDKDPAWLALWGPRDINVIELLDKGKPYFEDPQLLAWLKSNDPDFPVNQAIASDNLDQRWTGGKVPFAFVVGFPASLKTRILQAVDHFNQKCKLKFVARTNEANYLEFITGAGAWSHVGMQGGKQEICIATWCDFGSIVHEMCHALGLWHEQSRSDRDQFVEIVWANVKDEERHNFEQHVDDGMDIGAYDYGSIMHYPANAFSKNGQVTLKAKKPNAYLGQRRGLSEGDIFALNKLYSSTPSPPPGVGTAPPAQAPAKPSLPKPAGKPTAPAAKPVPEKEKPAPPQTAPATRAAVQSGFNRGNGKSYFFRGGQYFRYDENLNRVEMGYPLDISAGFGGVTWSNLDAAAAVGTNKALLFRGDEYLRYDFTANAVEKGFPKKLKDGFPGLKWTAVDAALMLSGNKLLLFKGSEVVRCDANTGRPESGFPKKITELFPGVWDAPDAALLWGGQSVYFFKGESYLKFNMGTKRVETGYPKPISGNWKGL